MLEVELPRECIAPRVARQLVADQFENKLSEDELSTARLLVSELVTNAVVHGRGKITFRALLDEARLLVEVIDEGAGPEAAVRERDFEDSGSGGHGLLLVDAESSRWGVHTGTGHVWFELEMPGPRIEPSGSGREQPASDSKGVAFTGLSSKGPAKWDA